MILQTYVFYFACLSQLRFIMSVIMKRNNLISDADWRAFKR